MRAATTVGPNYVVTPNPEIVEVCRADEAAAAASTARIWSGGGSAS